MAKIALLIGVSEYEPGLDKLPSAVNDVTAMQQVLTHPDMGEFADAAVTVLQNPDRQTMETAIYNLFANRAKDDLVLLYFSGHGVVDESGEFYFASRNTRKDQGRLVPITAVEAKFVQRWLEQSRSQRKVIILDSCFSGAFAKGVKAKDSGSVNPEQFLGGKGAAILTASTSTQYALTQEGFDLSVYTHYLVEGVRTGGADQDDDGFIAMEELHAYASSKVKEAAPAMTPEFYPVKEGYKILLAKSPKNDPKLRYRKQVKLLAEEDEGNFSFISRAYLDDLQYSLALLPDDATAIETEELEPYRQRRAKVNRYRTVFEGAITKQYPLTERDRLGLQRLQQLLSLRDEDVSAIEQAAAAQIASKSEAYRQKLQRYEQEFTRAIQVEFPLSQPVCEGLNKFQADLGLTDEDVAQIKQPVIERRAAEYQQQLEWLRRQDAEKLRQQQEAERLQTERQREQEYQQKLKRYEQEFSRAIWSSFPVDSYAHEGLKNFQQALALKDKDVARIEAPLLKTRETEYQKQQAEKLRQQQEAERLQQQEAERLREQQRRQQKEQSDGRQAELRQQQEAARLREQQEEQQKILEARQKQEQAERQREAEESRQKTTQKSISSYLQSLQIDSHLKRRLKRLCGATLFSGGFLCIALALGSLLSGYSTFLFVTFFAGLGLLCVWSGLRLL